VHLDIVIPAHNEEHRIDRTLHVYRAQCTHPDTSFVVALDRCTDGTERVVRAHADEDARVVPLQFPKLGKGGVLLESFRRCRGDVVGFVDADCATPPAELLRLVDAVGHADIAIASRRHPASVLPCRRSMSRRVASAGFAMVVRGLFRLPLRDTQCGAKVFRREAIERCLPFVSSRDLLFDVDVLVTARRLGFGIAEVPTVWIDQAGSRLRAGPDSLQMAASAVRLWLHHQLLPVEAPVESPVETPVEMCGEAYTDTNIVELRVTDRVSA
jgi:glycosyltransferase involved in cell wall biosynthesis